MKFLFLLFNLFSVLSLYSQKPEEVDVAIIGGGCAGLSAALVLSDYDWKTVVFSGPQKGGNLNVKTIVGNWPGRTTTRGYSIIGDLEKQLASFKVQIQEKNVVSCDFSKSPFEMMLSTGEKIFAKTVLVATGTLERKLSVPGFEQYWNKGIWSNDAFYENELRPYLATVKGKTVVIVGGGLDALRKAVYSVRGGAKKAILIVRDHEMKVDPKHLRKICAIPNIERLMGTEVISFEGNGVQLKSILCRSSEKTFQIEVENVVLAIGRVPNNALAFGWLRIDSEGRILLDQGTRETSIPGVFAAGDVTCTTKYGQGLIAAGEGMKTAYDILEYLRQVYPEKQGP